MVRGTKSKHANLDLLWRKSDYATRNRLSNSRGALPISLLFEDNRYGRVDAELAVFGLCTSMP